ncbi:hypothetical protein [Salipiger mangrovisoli]|uniref:Uncharacterized protein n=1 Tax=Salipiger mangrovisoli TaxID=2865933 RepID=A0ABR9X6D2_9RHOB|nr:hypothetical protein [Salipiger mangrovisoli]MBE9639165.1 hypothetical protein [Salipiger mangrovisoli]
MAKIKRSSMPPPFISNPQIKILVGMKLGTNIGLGFLESFTSSLMVFVRYVSRILRNRHIVLSMAQVEYPL